MQQVTLDEARAHLSELIAAAVQGETIVITQGEGETMIQRVPLPTQPRQPQQGTAKGLIGRAKPLPLVVVQ